MIADYYGTDENHENSRTRENGGGMHDTFIYRPHHNIQYTGLVMDVANDINESDVAAMETTEKSPLWQAVLSPTTEERNFADIELLFQRSTVFTPQFSPAITTTTLASIPATIVTTIKQQNQQMVVLTTAARPGININIIAYCYILPVICVLGIVGNLMNVVTLASPRLRAVSYMYLRALAVADLLCMLFVLAFACCEVLKEIGVPIERHPLYGFYQAHLMLSFINWALATGVFIVVALSLERYVSVVFPLHFRVWNSPQRAMKAIIVAYIVPALFYIPYGIGRYSVSERVNQDGEILYGAMDSEVSKTLRWQIYKWTREALLRFLPIVILFVLNSQIMIAFRRRQRMFDRLKNRDTSTSVTSGPSAIGACGRNSARDDTLLYILGGIAVMFFVCNIPAAINLLFINETMKKRLDYQIFRAMANLLEITNHAAQFYIFCVCSSDYRVTFVQKFPCLRAYYVNKSKLCSFLRLASQLPTTSKQRSAESNAARRAFSTGIAAGSSSSLRRSNSASMTTAPFKSLIKYGELMDKRHGIGYGSRISTKRNIAGADTGTFVRSTTMTAELLSTSGDDGRGITAKLIMEQDEPETSDVQLASEESLSDAELDMLLNQQECRRGMTWTTTMGTSTPGASIPLLAELENDCNKSNGNNLFGLDNGNIVAVIRGVENDKEEDEDYDEERTENGTSYL